MEKVLILSDPCIGSSDAESARFMSVLSHAIARHGDAQAVVLTGALAARGRAEDYTALARGLERLSLPVLAVPSPDDSRTRLATALPGLTRIEGGHMQSVLDLHRHRILTLDTRPPRSGMRNPAARTSATRDGAPESDAARPLRPGAGWLCPDRMAWLMHMLEEAGDRHRIVMMHHGPMKTGLPTADALRLEDGSELMELLASYPGTQVICAHPRRIASGVSRGVAWASLGGLARAAALDLDGGETRPGPQLPGYMVLLLQKHGTVLHHQELPS